MMNIPFVLASASPRRRELLHYLVDDFSIMPADVDETVIDNEKPYDLVERLSKLKAEVVWQQNNNCIVLGSDTVVACGKTVLGKPSDKNDFLSMMQMLSNDWHEVYTGICLLSNSHCMTEVVITKVKMTNITQQEALRYWDTQEPADKAGGYAIQGIGGQFVEKIEGSFSAVVGLPLYETKQLINRIYPL